MSSQEQPPRVLRGEAEPSELELELELELLEHSRGKKRQVLTRHIIEKFVLPELTAHRTWLIESGFYVPEQHHPVIRECLESIYAHGNLTILPHRSRSEGPDDVTEHLPNSSSLINSPMGRGPTKEGRNEHIFDEVEKCIAAGSSQITASKAVSEQIRQGRVNTIDQQVLSSRTVLNIHRKIVDEHKDHTPEN